MKDQDSSVVNVNWSAKGLTVFVLHQAAVALILLLGAASARGEAIGINVLLTRAPDQGMLADLGMHGQVLDVIPEINAVTMRVNASELATIQALPCVVAANPDRVRSAAECEPSAPDLSGGATLYNLDAINVTDFGVGRSVAYDGQGVYVAVIDSGLRSNWRSFFPEERIDTVHARGFGGGGGEQGTVSEQPDKWERDTFGHGTAVTSVLLGFHYCGPEQLPSDFNGVAPRVTVIPMRINRGNEHGDAWSSVMTRGVLYATSLKVSGTLGDAPLVINLSVGGPDPDTIERAAIDYAIANGIVVVASAGNDGDLGSLYPGAYPPVISAGASGWVGNFPQDDPTTVQWITRDVAENAPSQHFIPPFSGRELPGQDLDVVAPGLWVPVPWMTQNGQVDYSFVMGTSFSCPHVAGVAALMLQKNPGLTAPEIEVILESTAMPLSAGCRDVIFPGVGPGNPPTWNDHNNVFFFPVVFCWPSNATGHGLLQAAAALAATPLP